MPIFERDMNKYVVIKNTDLSAEQREELQDFLYDQCIQPRESVVVEADWPIYEQVWALVEDQWVSEITE